MLINQTWTQLKSVVTTKHLLLQYIEYETNYQLLAFDGPMEYECVLLKSSPASSDQQDFETNYKLHSNLNLVPIDEDGKPYQRAESRPLDMMTCFTMAGDHSQDGIGAGSLLVWDFSNSNNDITAPEGCKRKRIDISFTDVIRIKEGCIYFHNAIKGSYLDFYIVHPNPAVGNLAHYVIKHHFQGTCPMGDELNTEAASSEIPTGLILRLEVTVPDTDILSNGYVSVELYRRSTI